MGKLSERSFKRALTKAQTFVESCRNNPEVTSTKRTKTLNNYIINLSL